MKLPKLYEPHEYEAMIYELWEANNAFVPVNRGSDRSFSIVIPPPNANGDLHLGHALTLGVEDVAVRYHRMKGEAALLLPGADHAGFETQVVYERRLNSEGKSRFDFSREELYAQIWEFVAANKDNYQTQMRKVGASLDWSRYTYSLDDKVVRQAYRTFKKMWDEGLIYRGTRLVNFCTFHGTGFADIEVEYKETAGHLWHVRYPLTDGSGEVIVATTRPETMLGDVAVAVHPEDERYASLIGKTVKLPLTNREIPIIADSFVDTTFGTGAVKITPAHDQNDFEVAERHDLPRISVIGHEGTMTPDAGDSYRDSSVTDAREKVVADLEAGGFLVTVEDHTHAVGHCYKCGTVLQPLLREQWFIDMKPLTGPAIEALQAGKITFYPENKRAVLIRYLEGLKDWNISRQIAWGIPIPAYQNLEEHDVWIFSEDVSEEFIEREGVRYRRDPDVFDTWFSSSSWPYATLDYPDGEDFSKFYPLSVMETGADILFPWVSRMIMFGLYNTGEIPFTNVYLHGLVLDEHGQKMSKSKGNVIAPMVKIDEYGADALRMSLIAGQTPGQNQPFSEARLVAARNFCNKLWNVARFVENGVGDDFVKKQSPEPQTAADHWILERLSRAIELIGDSMEDYRFSEAYDMIYHTLWDDFADWYIEASKAEPNPGVMAYGLEAILKLAHPFAPFVTETIWQTLKWENDSLLITSRWPERNVEFNTTICKMFGDIKSVVSEARVIQNRLGLSRPILYHDNEQVIEQNAALITKLGKLGGIAAAPLPERENKDGSDSDTTSLRFSTVDMAAWFEVGTETARNYLDKLEAQRTETALAAERLVARLKNERYVANAPAQLVEETRQQLEEAKRRLESINAEIDAF